LKLATPHIFLHLLMYSSCPPHLNYATTLPCENYTTVNVMTKTKVAPFYLGHGVELAI